MSDIIIPKTGKTNSFPNWGFFTKEEIENNKGKLLMLDIDFGRYCSLSCPTCFRKSSTVDESEDGDLKYGELIEVIDDARKLGLRNIKICGAGEPTENPRFLDFITEMTKKNVGVGVFTKGQVLGNDEKARKLYHKYGVSDAKELCDLLSGLNVSFMLGFQSFDRELQDRLVGTNGHTIVRDKALENLIRAGFKDTNHSRLCLCDAPVTRAVYNEAFEVYKFAREIGAYPVLSLSMTSGKQLTKEFIEQIDLTFGQKVDLYTKIYKYNIEKGIQTLKQIEEEGISAMPGSHPCNQVSCGLYVTANGNVTGCPGFTYIEGNVKDESIKDIWEKSQNRRMVGKFNCGCPPKKDTTVPELLYETVMKLVKEG